MQTGRWKIDSPSSDRFPVGACGVSDTWLTSSLSLECGSLARARLHFDLRITAN
jgi:hypothetical protein